MRDRRMIRRRHAEDGSIRGTARDLGASRNAVRRALDPDARMEYSRASLEDEFEPAVRDVLADYPRLSVPQVAELVEWPGSRRQLTRIVARLRPAALERELEVLLHPRLGAMKVGNLTVGEMKIGNLSLGRINGISQDENPDPARSTL